MEVIDYLAGARETEAVGAVVLHRLRDRHVGLWHDIEGDGEGPPQLGPGRLLTHDAVRALTLRLSGAAGGRRVLPACVLVADSDLLAWHRPAARRPILFDTADKSLNADVSGRPVWHPPLLFVARPGRLCAYALGGDDRPDEATPLCRAPYYNLYASGAMCEGSVPLPPEPLPTAEVLDGYESAFYDSAFVHTNLGGGQLVRWGGGHGRFWRDMREAEQFPARALVPLHKGGRPLTVADVLDRDAPRVDPILAQALLGTDEGGAA